MIGYENSKSLRNKSKEGIKFGSNKIPTNPKTMVTISCAIEPITVINTPWILSACFRQKTLPPYSPTLLGVNDETVMPENTALSDVFIDTFSILEIKNLHFKDSTNQFKNIKKITKTKTEKLLFKVKKILFKSNCLKLILDFNWSYKKNNAKATIDIFNKKLIAFLDFIEYVCIQI